MKYENTPEGNARYVRDKCREKFGPEGYRKIVREAMDKAVSGMQPIELEARFAILMQNNWPWDWHGREA